MLLIGSAAMRKHGLDPNRKTFDTDYICTLNEYHDFVRSRNDVFQAAPLSHSKMVVNTTKDGIFEFDIAWNEGEPTTNDTILKLYENETVAPLELLLLLKLSHRYMKNSPHFYKTLCDIELLRKHGVTLPPELKKLLKRREKETYVYKHPKLNQDKKGFFKQETYQIYDHDTIHLAIKHLPQPAYEYYKGDTAEVFCDKKKFFELDEQFRLLGVLEEVLVLALERSQIPNNFEVERRWSFNKAHEKVCTSITSGFFREFAYDNFRAVQAMYNPNYVDRFKSALESGIVQPHKSE